jgi:CHAT domain-containing protein
MKHFCQFCLLLTLTFSSLTLAAQQSVDPGKTGFEHFQRGNFEQAIQAWEKVRDELTIDDLVLFAKAYQSLGQLKTARDILLQLLSDPIMKKEAISKANVLTHLSDLYIALGNLDLENKALDVAQICAQTETVQDKNLKEASNCIEDAIKEARKIVDKNNYPLLMANILNTKGNVLVAQGDLLTARDEKTKAAEKYVKALSLYKTAIQQADDNVLKAKILTNIVQAMAKSGNRVNVDFNEVWQQVRTLPDSHDKAFALISLAQLFPPAKKLLAYNALTQAIETADTLKDKISLTYAKMYLAKLYAREKRYREAIQLTREAITYAQSYPNINRNSQEITGANSFFISKRQEVPLPQFLQDDTSKKSVPYSTLFLKDNHPELLYRLEWQLGQFLVKKEGNNKKAIEAYQRAVDYANLFQDRCQNVSQRFREKAEKLYFELADLLLQQAAQQTDKNKNKKNKLLEEARKNIELYKEAELQNYFQSSCVTQLDNSIQNLSKDLPLNTAVFYPILFDDRIELLLTLRQGEQIKTLQFAPQPITKARLAQEIEKFRSEATKLAKLKKMEPNEMLEELGDFTLAGYTQNSLKQLLSYTKLYQWLIEPIADKLKTPQVKTLVIVPDDILRTVPFAALHNGKNFLIENYALAITPGLKLTELEKMPNRVKALLNGLSEKIAGYGKLNAKEELKKISAVLVNHKKLEDENFTISKMNTQLEKNAYSIVHFATHGYFAKNPNDSYLLTYDAYPNNDKPEKRLRMDCLAALMEVAEFRDNPVELLTFSACETALGRASLGLAGVAVKVGVRSALATLWAVDDTATRLLLTKFYRQLGKPESTKAQALQQAQKNFLTNEEYQHPYYWAAFLLIGNWL